MPDPTLVGVIGLDATGAPVLRHLRADGGRVQAATTVHGVTGLRVAGPLRGPGGL